MNIYGYTGYESSTDGELLRLCTHDDLPLHVVELLRRVHYCDCELRDFEKEVSYQAMESVSSLREQIDDLEADCNEIRDCYDTLTDKVIDALYKIEESLKFMNMPEHMRVCLLELREGLL